MADEPAITYEGIEHSEHDAMFRKAYALPGERLRVDPAARILTIDVKEIEAVLGREPLTVSKTVMSGIDDGGTRSSVIPEYEFEGVEGRFHAKAFQHEKGESGMHAVVAMRDGEMWTVPMDENDGGKILAPNAVAREIVGFAGRNQDDIHPEGLDGLKKELSSNENPTMLADVYHRNAVAFGDRTGPIEVVAMPMVYGAPEEAQTRAAGMLIDQAVFEKRINEVSRNADGVLRKGGLETADGHEPPEVTEMLDALQARSKEPSPRNSGAVLDAAEAMLGMMDDRSLSRGKDFDDLSRSVDAAGRAGDAVLRNRYSDLGLEPAAARDMESLARQHDAAMDAGTTKADQTPSRPSAASIGAASAAMMQQSR